MVKRLPKRVREQAERAEALMNGEDTPGAVETVDTPVEETPEEMPEDMPGSEDVDVPDENL